MCFCDETFISSQRRGADEMCRKWPWSRTMLPDSFWGPGCWFMRFTGRHETWRLKGGGGVFVRAYLIAIYHAATSLSTFLLHSDLWGGYRSRRHRCCGNWEQRMGRCGYIVDLLTGMLFICPLRLRNQTVDQRFLFFLKVQSIYISDERTQISVQDW